MMARPGERRRPSMWIVRVSEASMADCGGLKENTPLNNGYKTFSRDNWSRRGFIYG